MITHQEKVAYLIADAMKLYDSQLVDTKLSRNEYKQAVTLDYGKCNAAEVNQEYKLTREINSL